jgi:hypothetical protein
VTSIVLLLTLINNKNKSAYAVHTQQSFILPPPAENMPLEESKGNSQTHVNSSVHLETPDSMQTSQNEVRENDSESIISDSLKQLINAFL